jgi:hypothetical protein
MPIDYSKYPPNWKSEIRPAILKRADNECVCCGLINRQTVYSVKVFGRRVWISNLGDALRLANVDRLYGNEKYIKSVKVVLTVAHLDHDETNQNISLDRLKAMCQQCHLKYDAIEKSRRKRVAQSHRL